MPSVQLEAWIGFGLLVVVFLTIDLVIFHRDAHIPTLRESAIWTAVWVAIALVFNAFLWYWRGPSPGIEFLTGYLVEWSLSMDNVFVFAVIFRFFGVPLQYQYRVLFWGILGAIAMRLTFILVGAELIQRFDWLLPLFGLFLVYAGWKLAFQDHDAVDPSHNWLLRMGRRWFRVAKEDHGQQFFVREGGRPAVTPLFLVLLVIESTDVVFAVDSVPAIFGVTRDTFVIFTSNVFAILGLRALYFLLAGVMDMFRYLVYGLSAVLAFIGIKMIAAYWLERDGHHFLPAWVPLMVIALLIGTSIAASLVANHREARRKSDSQPPE